MVKASELGVKLSGVMLIAILAAAAAFGLIEPMIRVSPSAGVLAVLIGLAIADGPRATTRRSEPAGPIIVGRALLLATAGISLVFVNGALRDSLAWKTMRSSHGIMDFYRAVDIAPNNFEARVLLAYLLVGAKRCELAHPHLLHALRLQPFSGTVQQLRGRCSQIFQ
jgi:hypothetical protein